jgi:hypothetical protein
VLFSAQTVSADSLYMQLEDSVLSNREARYCEDEGILSRIERKFRYQVKHVPHLPQVEIAQFRNIHERRQQPYQEDWPIARRYCAATVDLSDGRSRKIWYLIEDGMGLAGMGDNVEFCVSGFDRWMVYNGSCRVLR